MTSRGSLEPYPQQPSAWGFAVGLWPAGGGPAAPQALGPVRASAGRIGRKQVHQSSIERWLFSGVVVVLVGCNRLGAIKPEWIGGSSAVGRIEVGIETQKSIGEAVYSRGVGRGRELGFAGGFVA